MDLTKDQNELLDELLDELLSFSVPVISDETRFWMVRTQKGYFYTEFITKKFVAIAWNTIDKTTDFSEQSRESLQDRIMIDYPEIHRPSTVVNKCSHFIHDIKSGDILVIPSKGSEYVTFAIAGEYFEESGKTVALENTVIERIRNNDVSINDVSCPYKKRRKIKLLRTIRGEDLSFALYRALSNYHGLSNLDSYSRQILNTLYNCYSFQGTASIVYNIRKTEPIKPSELSGLLYSNTSCLSMIISEEYISTQITLNSPGDIIYNIKEIWNLARDNWTVIFGLLVVLGGGSILSFKINGIIDIVKSILTAPSEIKMKKIESDAKELELLSKKLELYEKIKAAGIEPGDLQESLNTLYTSAKSLKSEPIVLGEASSIPAQGFEELQVLDLDDDQE